MQPSGITHAWTEASAVLLARSPVQHVPGLRLLLIAVLPTGSLIPEI